MATVKEKLKAAYQLRREAGKARNAAERAYDKACRAADKAIDRVEMLEAWQDRIVTA